MNCPYCTYEDTAVLESRSLPNEEGVRRRRQCKKCNKRFTTHETVVRIDLKVIKKDGRIEQYDRQKLFKGIGKACYKLNVSEDMIDQLVDEVEGKMLNRKTTDIKSSDIGKMVLNRLKRIDELAYMRFASVYLDFKDAADFKNFVLASPDINN